MGKSKIFAGIIHGKIQIQSQRMGSLSEASIRLDLLQPIDHYTVLLV